MAWILLQPYIQIIPINNGRNCDHMPARAHVTCIKLYMRKINERHIHANPRKQRQMRDTFRVWTIHTINHTQRRGQFVLFPIISAGWCQPPGRRQWHILVQQYVLQKTCLARYIQNDYGAKQAGFVQACISRQCLHQEDQFHVLCRNYGGLCVCIRVHICVVCMYVYMYV
jgi:hypothetical protein